MYLIQEIDNISIERFNAKIFIIKERTTTITLFSPSIDIF